MATHSYSKFLVTGGAGFIGSHIVDRLMAEGYGVVVLDDLSTGSLKNIKHHFGRENFRFVKGDVREPATVKKVVKGVEAVFHEAALVSVVRSVEDPVLTTEVNVLGTLNLLKICLDANVKRFVYASSTAVYGDSKILPLREDLPTCPISPYAVSKLAAENYCKLFYNVYGLETVCLRYFNVYGPRQPYGPYSSVIINFINRLERSKPPIIYGDGEQSRDFVNVRDVVEANMLALKCRKAVGDVFNIATGKPTTINRLAEMLLEITGKTHLKPVYTDPRPGDIRHNYADTSKAEKTLGYKPSISIRDGLMGLVNLTMG